MPTRKVLRKKKPITLADKIAKETEAPNKLSKTQEEELAQKQFEAEQAELERQKEKGRKEEENRKRQEEKKLVKF